MLNPCKIKCSHFCLTHDSSEVIYFCGDPHCLESLCATCKLEHKQFHIGKNTICMLLTFPMVLYETNQKILNAIKCLSNTIIDCKREEENVDYTDIQASNSKEGLLDSLEGLKREYKEILKQLEGPETFKTLKSTYGRDYEKELEDLTMKYTSNASNLNKSLDKEEAKYNLPEDLRVQKSSRLRGLGLIAKELRELTYKREQPMQSDIDNTQEEEDTKQNVEIDLNKIEEVQTSVIQQKCKRNVRQPVTNMNILEEPIMETANGADEESPIMTKRNLPKPFAIHMTKMKDQQAKEKDKNMTFRSFVTLDGSLYGVSPLDAREKTVMSKINLLSERREAGGHDLNSASTFGSGSQGYTPNSQPKKHTHLLSPFSANKSGRTFDGNFTFAGCDGVEESLGSQKSERENSFDFSANNSPN